MLEDSMKLHFLKFISIITALMSVLFISCTDSPTTQQGTPQYANTLIDDFSHHDTKSEIPLSIWTTYNDSANGGNSTIHPKIDTYPNSSDYKSLTPASDTTHGSMKFTYKLEKGTFKWDPFVGFSLNMSGSQIQANKEQISGVQFWTKGSAHTLVARISGVKDYAHYEIKVQGSQEWQLVQIPFKHMQQPSWGQVVDWDINTITHLDWMMSDADGQEGTLELDQVSWMMKGEYIKPKSNHKADYFKNNWQPTVDTLIYLENPRYGIQKIAPYYGFKKGAYALTFDDALVTHYRETAPILDRHDIKATFYLITNYLGDENTAPTWRFGYWENFLDLQRKGHDLAGHDGDALSKYEFGDETAPNTVQFQLASSRTNLESKIPDYRVLSYAYPMVDHNLQIEAEGAHYYPALRSGSPASMSHIDSLIPWTKLHSRVVQFSRARSEDNDRIILDEIQNFIENEVIAKGNWHIFTAHDVLPLDSILAGDPGYHSLSKIWLTEFTDWLSNKSKKGELWVAPMSSIIQYIKEASSASWGVISEDEQSVVINLIDQVEDGVYVHPLTVEVKVPTTWSYLTVNQNSQQQIYGVNNGLAQVNIIPDGGIATLTIFDIEKAAQEAKDLENLNQNKAEGGTTN